MEERQQGRVGRVVAVLAAASMGLIGVPTVAMASVTNPVAASMAMPTAFFKKKGKKKKKGGKKKSGKKKKKKKKKSANKPPPGLTVDEAATKRQAIRDSVADVRESDPLAAAEGLEDNGKQLGDPVVLVEAGELRLEVAKKERDISQAEASIEVTTVAIDILHYYDSVASGDAESDWLVIDPSEASGMISSAESQVSEAESLIEEIEDEEDEGEEKVAAKPKKKKKKRGKAKPGTGLVIGGSLLTVAGVAGGSIAIVGLAGSRKAQDDVTKLGEENNPMNQPEIDKLDEKGGRLNRLGYIGLGIGIVGLAAGLPMLIIGAKRMKQGGGGKKASVQVGPMVAGTTKGFVLSGRF